MIYATAIGRLTNGATMAQTKNGKTAINFSLATSVNDYLQTNIENTQYLRCTYFGNTNILKCLEKGRRIAVYGSIELRNWIDNTGETHTDLKCIVSKIELLDVAKKGEITRPVEEYETDTTLQSPKGETSSRTISNKKVAEIFNENEESGEIPF